MDITEEDILRSWLYNKRNGFGRPIYTVGEIAKLRGVSRQAVYYSLGKMGYRPRQERKDPLDKEKSAVLGC